MMRWGRGWLNDRQRQSRTRCQLRSAYTSRVSSASRKSASSGRASRLPGQPLGAVSGTQDELALETKGRERGEWADTKTPSDSGSGVAADGWPPFGSKRSLTRVIKLPATAQSLEGTPIPAVKVHATRRWLPNATTFIAANCHLRETVSARITKPADGERQCGIENDDLNCVADNARISTWAYCCCTEHIQSTVSRVVITSGETVHAFHFQPVQSLRPPDSPARVQYCEGLLSNEARNPHFSDTVLFTDEASFTRDGIFNYHDGRVWAHINLHVVRESLFQHLLILNHNIAPAHYNISVREYFDATYPQRWIGRGGPLAWPPRSPDLNASVAQRFWAALNIGVLNIDGGKARKPPGSDITRHGSHKRKFGSDPVENRTRFASVKGERFIRWATAAPALRVQDACQAAQANPGVLDVTRAARKQVYNSGAEGNIVSHIGDQSVRAGSATLGYLRRLLFESLKFLTDQFSARQVYVNLDSASKDPYVLDSNDRDFEVSITGSPDGNHLLSSQSPSPLEEEKIKLMRDGIHKHQNQEIDLFSSLLPHIKTLPGDKKMLLQMEIQQVAYRHVYGQIPNANNYTKYLMQPISHPLPVFPTPAVTDPNITILSDSVPAYNHNTTGHTKKRLGDHKHIAKKWNETLSASKQTPPGRPSTPDITAGNPSNEVFIVVTLHRQDVQRWGRAVRRHSSSLQPTASWTRLVGIKSTLSSTILSYSSVTCVKCLVELPRRFQNFQICLLERTKHTITFKMVSLSGNIVIPAFLPLLECLVEVFFSKSVKHLLRFALTLRNGIHKATFELDLHLRDESEVCRSQICEKLRSEESSVAGCITLGKSSSGAIPSVVGSSAGFLRRLKEYIRRKRPDLRRAKKLDTFRKWYELWKRCITVQGIYFEVVRLLTSDLGEPGSITGGVIPGFAHVGISRFPRPLIPALLRIYLTSPSSAFKSSMSTAAQIFPLTHSLTRERRKLKVEVKQLPMEHCTRLYNVKNS
ncbi:hypothetical protein PR048_015757 [Dryococelus australis]|uniref:BESS domain-containing protein n=1 Tax=Dryococelus australis TaxID=614101 RepID=A0ABQ9HHU5_9NEOP|nr:hypothetical protein PR048_015757 [Dryococelus australis]